MTCNMKLLLSVFRANCKYCKIYSRCFYENVSQKQYAIGNEASIKDCLQASSIQFVEGYTCYLPKKCFCGKYKSSFAPGNEVFINKRTGFFLCERCRVTADWETYSHLLTKSKEEKFDKELSEKYFVSYNQNAAMWDDVVKRTQSLEYNTDKVCSDVFQSFNLKPYSRWIIQNLGIRINDEENLLYFPLYQLQNVVGFKTYHINGEQNVFPRINCPGLLKSPTVSNSICAVVVADICDFLALVSVKLQSYDIICLPYGTSHIPQSTLPLFEKYEKIILWLGKENLDTIGNISEKFNEKRCFIVKAGENQFSASVALSNNQSIINILSDAKLSFHQYVTTFSAFRDGVLAELQNETQIVGVPWKKFPTLTKILKGHRRGELTLLTGPTGVGKTTFLSEYSIDLASQGVHTLWGSFEIKNVRLAKIMLTQFGGAPLPYNLSEFNVLCDKFERLPVFFLTFHGQQSLVDVMDALSHCSYVYDIAHVIIDNVQFMIEVSPDSVGLDRFFRQDYMIQKLRSFASQNNCHVTLVMHPRKTEGFDLAINSIFGGAKASQEADNILIIQKKEPNESNNCKFLEIAKNRFSGDLGSFPLHFYKPALSFSEKNATQLHLNENSQNQFLERRKRN